MKYRFDAADHPVLDLEQLSELPGPVDAVMVEKRECKHDASLGIGSDETAIPYAIDDAVQ